MTRIAVAFLFLLGTASAVEVSPPEILASVRVGRDGGCSGVVVAQDDNWAYGVSCSHCRGANGTQQSIGIGTVKGITVQGEWIASDADHDLSLFKFPVKDMVGIIPVAIESPKNGNWRAVGFPQTAGPKLKRLEFQRVVENAFLPKSNRWQSKVVEGTYDNGDSGGGVFDSDHQLIGIMSHGDPPNVSQCARLPQLQTFIDTNLPPTAKRSYRCVDGRCILAAPPPIPPLGQKFRLDPSQPIVLPDAVPRDGTFPDKVSSAYIVELVKRIEALERRVASLETGGKNDAPVPPLETPIKDAPPAPLAAGPKGDSGRDGRDGVGTPGKNGVDGKPGTVTVVIKWADGTPISQPLANLVAGSRVIVPVKKVISDPKK